jgi:hypothetical protein
MRGVASFVMRGRWQATVIIVVGALLPLLNVFSGAALALVTLRRGSREGLRLMLMSAALACIPFAVMTASVAPALGLLALFWAPLWVLATALRVTVSLADALRLAVLIAALALLGFNGYVGDATAWGRALLEQVLTPLLTPLGLTERDPQGVAQLFDYMAPLVLGLLFANTLASLLCCLLLGRWWQALLYNPGGFRREYHELRLGRPTTLVALLICGLALTFRTPWLLAWSLLLMVIYTLQGLAVAHGIVAKAGLARSWLVGLYVLAFFALPQMLVLLCLLGASDAWGDFRARYKTSG